jgi:carbon storage regulator CsrA
MLLLERCLDTAICIGHNIKVKVLKTGAHRVLLGIDAPRDVPVWRDELAPPAEVMKDEWRRTTPFRVLAVEDNPDHAELIKLALQACPVAQVTVVRTGEDAIRALGQRESGGSLRPDLVLLDLQLPGLSGFDVLKLIRSVPILRKTPVVVLSCSKNDDDVRRAIEAGANAFVAKASGNAAFNESIFRIADFWSNVRQVA